MPELPTRSSSSSSLLVSTELTTGSSSWSNPRPDRHNAALHMAQQLLPNLLQALGVASSRGDTARVQVDSVYVRCTRMPGAQQWHFTLDHTSSDDDDPDDDRLFKLCLPMPLQDSAASSQDALPGHKQSPEAAGCWRVKLQLRCRSRHADFHVQGWHPDLPDQPTTGAALTSGRPTLQVLTESATAFLHTQVLSCVPSPHNEPGLHILEVAIHAAPHQLLRHHPGGPVMDLQPITLQLWFGDVWFSSTDTIMCIDQLAPGAPPALSPEQCCSWWGASPQVSRGCIRELHHLAELLWEEQSAASEQLTGHADLMHDMCTWLAAVMTADLVQQRCLRAVHSETTWSRYQGKHMLSKGLVIADSLLAYVRQGTFRHTQRLILAQRQVVRQACAQLNTVPGHQPSLATHMIHHVQQLLPAVRAELCGYTCLHCEALHRQQATVFLAPACMCSAALLCLVCLALMWKEKNAVALVAMAIVVFLHALVLTQLAIRRRNRAVSHLCLAVSLLRLLYKVATLLGILPLPTATGLTHGQYIKWMLIRGLVMLLDCCYLTGLVSRRWRTLLLTGDSVVGLGLVTLVSGLRGLDRRLLTIANLALSVAALLWASLYITARVMSRQRLEQQQPAAHHAHKPDRPASFST